MEGPNLVEAALRRGAARDIFATDSALRRFGAVLADAGVPVHRVTDRAAKALSDTVTPVGLVAVCEQPAPALEQVLASRPELVAVAVGLSEPGNAGTLIRLADAMGADAVALTGHSVDPYNAKCLRASAGSVFAIPVLAVPDTAAVVGALARTGLQVLATAVDGDIDLDEAQPLLSRPTAFLFGPEAHGLPDDVADMASHRVRIPMTGQAESLNVASAAAICLYECFRARRGQAAGRRG